MNPLVELPAFDTARLHLRDVTEADLPDLLQVNGDPQVTRFLPRETWQSLDDAHAWLARMQALCADGTARQWVLALRDGIAELGEEDGGTPPPGQGGRVVGTLLLFRHEPVSRRLELGYVLGRPWWGRGLMREAVAGACRQLFAVAGLRRLEAEVDPANTASHRLLLALGFQLEGRLRQRWLAKGRVYDTHFYGLLAEDWARDGGPQAAAVEAAEPTAPTAQPADASAMTRGKHVG